MQLILESESTIEIGEMADIQENITEKLVNRLIKDYNLGSSDEENVQYLENGTSNLTEVAKTEVNDKNESIHEADDQDKVSDIRNMNNQIMNVNNYDKQNNESQADIDLSIDKELQTKCDDLVVTNSLEQLNTSDTIIVKKDEENKKENDQINGSILQEENKNNENICIDVEMDVISDNIKDEICHKSESLRDAKEQTQETDKIDSNFVNIIDCEEVTQVNGDINTEPKTTESKDKNEVMIVEEDEMKANVETKKVNFEVDKKNEPDKSSVNSTPIKCKLSNNLDIFSDDEDEEPIKEKTVADLPKDVIVTDKPEVPSEKQCINIEDDDDIMVIEVEAPSKDKTLTTANESVTNENLKVDEETGEKKSTFMESIELVSNNIEKECTPSTIPQPDVAGTKNIKDVEKPANKEKKKENLLPENVLKLSKKKLSDMTREDLEEFCILKILESIMGRSQLSDISAKITTMANQLQEYKKKAAMLTRQNRDLQVVLKSVQEGQKKINDTYNVIIPLKITRSVGMQVMMAAKPSVKRKIVQSVNPPRQTKTGPAQTPQRPQKPGAPNQNIPVPRLVPASNTVVQKNVTTVNNNSTFATKPPTPVPGGTKTLTPPAKVAEKRPISKTHAPTVDLTDDEPPAKVPTKNYPVGSMRVVPSQNLMPTPRPQSTLSPMVNNSPRKVFIPIGSQANQNIRSGHTYMLKTVAANNVPRTRMPVSNLPRLPQAQSRVRPGSLNRHPAPLPDAMKQYQPPNWKSLPPAPDLKLSKVANGIVISWKIDGYLEDSYEQIASYQLYAYQETNAPPNTKDWKKIGDVKALPLPMACTLTQFMTGFKYYFAVRAVDVRSRLGPFSLPGSIILVNKMQ